MWHRRRAIPAIPDNRPHVGPHPPADSLRRRAATPAAPRPCAPLRLPAPASACWRAWRPAAPTAATSAARRTPHERALARALGLPAADGLHSLGGACRPQAGRDAGAAGLGLHHALPLAGRHGPGALLDPGDTGAATTRHRRALLAAHAALLRRRRHHAAPTSRPTRWLASGELFRGLRQRLAGRVVAAGDLTPGCPTAPAAPRHPAPPAERDADAALHPPRQRRARSAAACRRSTPSGSAAPARWPQPCPARADAARARRACAQPRAARRLGRLGAGLAGSWTPTSCAALLAALRARRAGARSPCAANGPRRPSTPRPTRRLVAVFKHVLARSPRRTCSSSYENHSPRHPAARRLGAGAGRRAPAAGAPVRRARRAPARTNSTTAWRACCRPPAMKGTQEAAVLLADAIAAEQAPVHRGRLRLRRRHRLRRGACAACACWARQHVELPRARPRGRRLRPHRRRSPSASRPAAPTC